MRQSNGQRMPSKRLRMRTSAARQLFGKSERLTAIGLTALSLTACAGSSVEVRTEPVTPPATLLDPCAPPSHRQILTNEDLLIYATDALRAYSICAARVDALRVFFHKSD